jgi:hypothetical protein
MAHNALPRLNLSRFTPAPAPAPINAAPNMQSAEVFARRPCNKTLLLTSRSSVGEPAGDADGNIPVVETLDFGRIPSLDLYHVIAQRSDPIGLEICLQPDHRRSLPSSVHRWVPRESGPARPTEGIR